MMFFPWLLCCALRTHFDFDKLLIILSLMSVSLSLSVSSPALPFLPPLIFSILLTEQTCFLHAYSERDCSVVLGPGTSVMQKTDKADALSLWVTSSGLLTGKHSSSYWKAGVRRIVRRLLTQSREKIIMALSNIAEIQNKGQHILKVELTALTNDWNKEKYIF